MEKNSVANISVEMVNVEMTCNCGCGCEVPLDWGTCVDCGDGTHQNNNELLEYKN
jgi:hypothetical protein